MAERLASRQMPTRRSPGVCPIGRRRGCRKRNLGIRMLAPPTRASGAGLARHPSRHCAFAATTHRNRRSSGRRVSRSFVGRVRTAWGKPRPSPQHSVRTLVPGNSGGGWLTVAMRQRVPSTRLSMSGVLSQLRPGAVRANNLPPGGDYATVRG